MASEDVIELGSSDDEAEPVSKKMKPVPNAMVHIPRGVTIKPAKPNSLSIPKQLSVLEKSVTITNISKGNAGNNFFHNPYAVKKKIFNQNVHQRNSNFSRTLNTQVALNKLPKPHAGTKILSKPIKIGPPRTINSLPPSITVTRTTSNLKRPSTANIPVFKKRKVVKPTFTEVPTVELDDDDVSPSSNASPQWYLRPEDQLPTSMEEVNNKEPEKPQLVEITIEDSPVKPPPQNKQTCEVIADHAVTIEDSPVKALAEDNTVSNSDTENCDTLKLKEKHSKKKLEYPKENEAKTIEIEIPPIGEGIMNDEIVSNKSKCDIIEIEESPLKLETQTTGTPKKNNKQSTQDLESAKSIEGLQDDDVDLSDFHPVYRDFIKLCFRLENSDDMKKIVEKKIKTYYRQVPKDYTESEEFIDMVSSKIVAMKAGPQKMYLYIKDVVDELNFQRKLTKSQTVNTTSQKKSESNEFLYGEDSVYDSKRQRQIRKLEKTLKKLHRAIQKLETQEVDFDDDEDSVYLLTESDEGSSSNKDSDKQLGKDPKALLKRYKERMVRVHAKFCQLTNTKMPSEPRVHIESRPGHPSGPAKRLEKWINKKVAIGTPLPFPDFHDVLRCVREANEEDKLGWNDVDIMEEARDLFTRCGKKLQRRRQENEWRLAASRITTGDNDPAESNEELNKKLEDNKKIASKKETELFNKFADRQSQLKLEAQEIGDKEAEESPVESDDEEPCDELSLENKDKRKERLKRLLQEKSQKAEENNSNNNVNGSQGDRDMIVTDKTEDMNVSRSLEDSSNEDKKSETLDKEKSNTGNQEHTKETTEESTNITPDINEKQTSARDINKSTDDNKSTAVNSNTSIRDKKITDENRKAQSVSDDSNALESDMDELHLLQKLHSGSGGNTSTIESSDSETPIAISDTLGSSSENNKQASDIISIENSSYSESETTVKDTEVKDNKTLNAPDKVDDEIFSDTEIECAGSSIQKKTYLNSNNEYNEPVEDILLASSDDETGHDNSLHDSANREGDNLSIGNTVLEEIDKASNATGSDCAEKQEDSNSVESVGILSTKSDPLDKIIIDEVQGNIKESDYTDKKEDTSSLDSVTYVSNEDVSSDDKIVNKADENANKATNVIIDNSDLCNENESKNNKTDILSVQEKENKSSQSPIQDFPEKPVDGNQTVT